jgi:NhaP-type Na+/H+ or K+/H+ antiporter
MYEEMALLAVLLFLHSQIVGRVESAPVSGPLIFAVMGFIAGPILLGWFGPRGLASIVFAIIVQNTELPGAEFMAGIVACTVLFSLIAHGISANPLAARLVRARKTRTSDRFPFQDPLFSERGHSKNLNRRLPWLPLARNNA